MLRITSVLLICQLLCCPRETAADELGDIPRVDLLETDEIVTGSFFEDQQQRRGLALSRDVLEKVYYRNALQVYPRLKEVAGLTSQIRDAE